MVGPQFPTPWRLVCCLVLAILFPLSRCIRHPAMSLSPLPHPAPGPVPTPLPSSRVYTPTGCQQPHCAGPLDPHPSGDRFMCLARVAFIPPPYLRVVPFLLDALGTLLPGPAPVSHPFTRAYTPPGRLHPMCIPHPTACHPVALGRGSMSCLMRRLPLFVLQLPVRSVLCVLWWCIDVVLPGVFFLRTSWAASPLPYPLCVRGLSCGFLFLLCVFVLPSSLHARTSPLHWSTRYSSLLCSSLVLSPTGGVSLGGPRPCKVGAPPWRHPPLLPLSSPLPALPRLPVSRPSPYCCSPAPCALCCSSPH